MDARRRRRSCPSAVPAILGEDRGAGCFAMAYLAPDVIRCGRRCCATARSTRRRPRPWATCSAGSTPRPPIAPTSPRAFRPTTSSTRSASSRISSRPARAHPRPRRRGSPRWSTTTRSTKRVLVHGDFSPKNILVGPAGPVILDAECAWYGDPAFDLAFVLNHLLLKGAWRPAMARALCGGVRRARERLLAARRAGSRGRRSRRARRRCCRR